VCVVLVKPFLSFQTIVSTEVTSKFSSSGRCLKETMERILIVAGDDTIETLDQRLHAFNILRGLFKHAQLGEFVSSYISIEVSFIVFAAGLKICDFLVV